jgi:hypothetical protein
LNWQVEGYLEKQSVGAQVSAVPMSRPGPGRMGAFGVERRSGAKAGAWGGKSLRRRAGVRGLVTGASGVTGCVFPWREIRVSCRMGGVGWCLKPVRAWGAAHHVLNSQRIGWRGGSVNKVRGAVRGRGGVWRRGM